MRSPLYAVLGSALLLLTGCGFSPTQQPLSPSAGSAITGRIHGGQQPVVGAHVYLLAANTAGYNTGSTPTYSSVSLLNAAITGQSDAQGAYVVTGSDGGFSITGDYTCTPGQQVYVYAKGGNPGAGTNTAATFLAVVGNCPAAGNFATTVPFIWMNEVSTVAAAYSMAGFAFDAVHVSSSSTALAKIDIANAFANAANLVDVATGTALTTTPAGNGVVPQSTINTLANILAACVNASDTNNGNCTTLFSNAHDPYGNVPTDTASAAINIAHLPGANVSALFNLTPASAPFAPTLATAPHDYTMALKFTGGGMNDVNGLAIDGSGNVWSMNYGNLLVKLSPTGSILSGSTGYTGGNLNVPTGIAIDPLGNVWVTSYVNSSVVKYGSDGTALSPGNGYNVGAGANALAIDSLSNVWVTLPTTPGKVAELSNAGVLLSGSGYSIGFTESNPWPIAIDAGGNAWVGNLNSNSVSKLSSSGTLLSGFSGYQSGGISAPIGLQIDPNSHVWVVNHGSSSSLSVLDSTGAAVTATPYPSGESTPVGLTIDGAGNVFNFGGGSYVVSELRNDGTLLLQTANITESGGHISDNSVAVDGSGNLWFAGAASNSITELVGVSIPVVTPIAASLLPPYTAPSSRP